MNKKVKIGLIIGGVGAALVGLYFLWDKVIKPKTDAKTDEDDVIDETIKDVEKAKKDVEKANSTSNSANPSTSSTSTSSTTTDADFATAQVTSWTIRTMWKNFPSDYTFTTKAKGDFFRKWVNKYFPTYAKSIDLDPSGSHTNAFIKKAWKRLGGAYMGWMSQYKENKRAEEGKIQADAALKAKTISVGDYVKVTTRSKLTAYEGNPLNKNKAIYKYSAPSGYKYKVVKKSKDATSGVPMLYIFNSADKLNGFSIGRGFQLYEKYTTKTTF